MHKTITDEHATAPTEVASISHTLAQRIGPDKYRVWFGGTSSMALIDGCLKITVPNTFTANWIQTHYLDRITSIAETVLGYRPKIGFTITSPSAPKGPKAIPGHRVSDSRPPQQGHRAAPPKEARLTLESFVVGPSNELAFNAAKAILREGQSPFNPLFIHGGYGVGKTHLLQGICHELAAIRPRSSCLYLSAEDFANQFIMALKLKKLEDFRRRIRQLDLLAIDDIHFLANKPSTQEEFFHTFNTISLAGKQVVLASDASPKMIKQLSEKLINRFVSGMVVRIDPPDLTTRYRICNQYVSKVTNPMSGAKGTSQPVPEIVIRFVAENVRANVRELEGSLLRVMAYASLQSGPVTLETAKQALADLVERPDATVLQLSPIESAVSAYFGVTAAALHSARKDRTVCLARHFCIYLARKHTRLSCVELGKQMGNKNHATIIVACKKIADLVTRNAEIHWLGQTGNKISQAQTVLIDIESRFIR